MSTPPVSELFDAQTWKPVQGFPDGDISYHIGVDAISIGRLTHSAQRSV